ncbi:hypothetical protein CPCC7001_1712 [Cyanobium sp. PCC 7001]|uniref:hypothetical protein n=1 Tax=Cyanobium sp. PCC 7001 TaxID=180281 RepID=UPI0001805D21|nr:hypothetical protein [Cyanobium sp. PCC 7001]EDY38833.1 hypothetical protein CPCC7001_1712 [Cyanobium sp. PCC 7001]
MLELLNATGKLPAWFTSSPRVLAFRDPPILEALRQLRPRLWRSGSAAIPEAFLSTRRLRIVAVDGAGSERYLLPLVDLANHHPLAPPFNLSAGHLRLLPSPAVPSAQLCVDYGGSRDGLDIALHYAYVDPDVRWAFSAPLRFELPGLGPVLIQGRPLESSRLGDPPLLSHGPVGEELEGTVVSHVCFAPAHAAGLRDSLRRELGRYGDNRGLGFTLEQVARLASALIEAVAARNVALLEAVAGLCARTSVRGEAPGVLASAALNQVEVIRSAQAAAL